MTTRTTRQGRQLAAVQVAEACLATRPYNGGLLGLDLLRSLVLVRASGSGEARSSLCLSALVTPLPRGRRSGAAPRQTP